MRKETKAVILPSGACEVYGPHLPLGSDILVALTLAKKAADKVVGPCLEVSQSQNIYEFPGAIYIKPENIKNVYRDIIEGFIKWGL